jgi:lysophospholipase L1-like esterase
MLMPSELKKLVLSVLVTVMTLALGLALIYCFAPHLLRRANDVPADIRLVRVDTKVPPFYDHIFDYDRDQLSDDYHGHKIYLQDPRLGHRSMPLLEAVGYKGPHDVLGFRNRGVPNRFDVLTMGDSQTYGANALVQDTWPSQMIPMLVSGDEHPEVYNVSLGGWAAVHYYYLFGKMLAFKPKVAVIAHYMGNDSIECFRLAYVNDIFKDLIPNLALSQDDLPKLPSHDEWRVEFADRTVHVFTPQRRLICNARNKVVDAGYEILKRASQRISRTASENGVQVVYTIIPNKETVFARKVSREGLAPPQNFQELVTVERERIGELAHFLEQLPGSRYVDLLEPLESAVMGPERFYRFNVDDGHPFPLGYGLIAKTLAPAVRQALNQPPAGQARKADRPTVAGRSARDKGGGQRCVRCSLACTRPPAAPFHCSAMDALCGEPPESSEIDLSWHAGTQQAGFVAGQ